MTARPYGDAPYLDAILVWNEEKEELTLFAVNKDLEEDMEIPYYAYVVDEDDKLVGGAFPA